MTEVGTGARERSWTMLSIAVVGLAGLLLEIAYTRVFSFKLWYYYTYLVIGLALLGIGSGAVLMAVVPRLKRATTRAIVAGGSIWGSVSITIGYVMIARMPIDTVEIWAYWTLGSLRNLAALATICLALFATFLGVGVIVAAILGRARDEIGRVYFADLFGAGLACVVAIPLISLLSPPEVILLAALLFGVLGIWSLPRRASIAGGVGVVMVVVLGLLLVETDRIPLVRTEDTKIDAGAKPVYSEWGPVFRVDALQFTDDADLLFLAHDGTFGSALHRFDGDPSTLDRAGFGDDPRATPFQVMGGPPERTLIIGSAGGHEILTSLNFDVPRIEAVELNPVTVSLLTDHFADYTGRLPERAEVELHQADGRTYLARSDGRYDLIWFVAPDSYAATNAASSGAFVLSESYLYTVEMIAESLERLTDDGIIMMQFGELAFDEMPNRTARYVVTAREALRSLGVDDPSSHLLVSVHRALGPGDLANIVVKRTPFTEEEIARFSTGVDALEGVGPVYIPDAPVEDSIVSELAGATDDEVRALVEDYPREIGPVRDDAPFFWHFNSFPSVVRDLFTPLDTIDPEDSIGERVLLLLLGFAALYAAVFLLAPFLFVRRQWRAFPAKGTSAVYFAALGLGFMLYEITMIQRLVRFLGYPTYSLTVTLAAILVSTGIGALASRRFAHRPALTLRLLLVALAVLTIGYRLGLDPLTDTLQAEGLAVRVLLAALLLLPLGLCLGMFMPLGLGVVSRLGGDGESYAAWSWAVNGFFSVIGAVLTTILSMMYGFRTVQLSAFVLYVLAVVAFGRLEASARRGVRSMPEPDAEPAVVEATTG